jgi:beta-N-acetylhexosaminidase
MLGFDAGASPAVARKAVGRHALGAITMIGRNDEGTDDVREITEAFQDVARLPLLVATDQEGGEVQVLQGPGFPVMPRATDQGRLPVSELQSRARNWGRALAKAGVNVNLAPVLDVVPASIGTANQPIGRYHRQLGSTAPVVAAHGLAVVAGLQSARIAPVVKHFPGLGSVTGSTDVTGRVVDSTTSARSAALDPFRAAVDAGVPAVMVSSATYARIDGQHIAMFSRAVVTDLLRDDLGFTGVVVSDDVGAARAVRAAAPVAARAVRFLLAGGDLVLTVRVTDLPAMAAAVIARARANPRFAATVDAAATRVLALKDQMGLLPCSR